MPSHIRLGMGWTFQKCLREPGDEPVDYVSDGPLTSEVPVDKQSANST